MEVKKKKIVDKSGSPTPLRIFGIMHHLKLPRPKFLCTKRPKEIAMSVCLSDEKKINGGYPPVKVKKRISGRTDLKFRPLIFCIWIY